MQRDLSFLLQPFCLSKESSGRKVFSPTMERKFLAQTEVPGLPWGMRDSWPLPGSVLEAGCTRPGGECSQETIGRRSPELSHLTVTAARPAPTAGWPRPSRPNASPPNT